MKTPPTPPFLVLDLYCAGALLVLRDAIGKNQCAKRFTALPFCLSIAVVAVADLVVASVVNVFVLIKNIAFLEGGEFCKGLIFLIARPIVGSLVGAATVVAAPFITIACLVSNAAAQKVFPIPQPEIPSVRAMRRAKAPNTGVAEDYANHTHNQELGTGRL